MRPVEYDFNAIIEAGKDLEAEGKPVTGYALRKRVGGGSADRLRATWDDWVSKQAATSGQAELMLPTQVVDRLDTTAKKLRVQLAALLAELHGQLKAVSVQEIAKHDEEAQRRENSLRNELKDAAETLDESESRAAVAEAGIKTLQDELATATAMRHAAEVRYAEAAAQKAALSDSLKSLQAAIDKVEAQMRSLDAERNEALRVALACREELAQAKGETSAMRKQIKDLLDLVAARGSKSD